MHVYGNILQCLKRLQPRPPESFQLRAVLHTLVSNRINFEVKSDHRSKFSNLSNWKEEA